MFKKVLLSAIMLAAMSNGLYAQEASLPQSSSAPAPPIAVVAPHTMPTEHVMKPATVRKDERVAAALENKNLTYVLLQPAKVFRVTYNMPNGRHHSGLIDSFNEKLNTNDPNTPSVRRIWSIAYSSPDLPSSGTLAKLMMASNQTKIGAWEIVKEQNGDYTVLFRIKADANTPPDTLVWMLQVACNIAETAEKEHESVDAALHASDSSYKPVIDKF